jgi:hypothetical protein
MITKDTIDRLIYAKEEFSKLNKLGEYYIDISIHDNKSFHLARENFLDISRVCRVKDVIIKDFDGDGYKYESYFCYKGYKFFCIHNGEL